MFAEAAADDSWANAHLIFSFLSNFDTKRSSHVKYGETSSLVYSQTTSKCHFCPGGLCCGKFAKLCEETIIDKTGSCTYVNTPAQKELRSTH